MRTNSSGSMALIGKGLLAGLVGTAAMTASSTLEMKLRNREASNAPADAAAKVLSMDFEDEESKARFGNLVHWGYGAGWGAVRGLIGAAGLEGVPAALAHFGVVLGAEQAMLPALEVAPPIWEWGAEEVAVDIFHHVVYTAATDLAYIYLKG
ncbi:MAG: hypothetical protein ACR2GU_01295 [Rubrobacteraceae bacterium]